MSDDPVSWVGALAASIPVSAITAGGGVLVRRVAARAADGRLGPNYLAGIRTPATTRTDETWLAAHRAGRSLTERGGMAFVLAGTVSLLLAIVAALIGNGAEAYMVVWVVVLLVGVVVATALVAAGAVAGHRAAMGVRGGSAGSEGPGELSGG